jgi:Flp pilus assembly protein TadG
MTTVEFALTVPLLFFLFFSALEFARANMIRHSVQTASYEGARRGIFPGASAQDVRDGANLVLAAVAAVNATVTVNPTVIDNDTPDVTVTVSVPLDDNGWVVPKFFAGRELTSTTTLTREHIDEFSFE